MVVTNVGEFGQQLQALRAQVVSASVIGSKLSRNTNNFAMGPWGSSIYSHYNSNSNDKNHSNTNFPAIDFAKLLWLLHRINLYNNNSTSNSNARNNHSNSNNKKYNSFDMPLCLDYPFMPLSQNQLKEKQQYIYTYTKTNSLVAKKNIVSDNVFHRANPSHVEVQTLRPFLRVRSWTAWAFELRQLN